MACQTSALVARGWISSSDWLHGGRALVRNGRGNLLSFWKCLCFIFPTIKAGGCLGAWTGPEFATNTFHSAPGIERGDRKLKRDCLGGGPAVARIGPFLFLSCRSGRRLMCRVQRYLARVRALKSSAPLFFLTGSWEEENGRAWGTESLSEKKAIRERREARLMFSQWEQSVPASMASVWDFPLAVAVIGMQGRPARTAITAQHLKQCQSLLEWKNGCKGSGTGTAAALKREEKAADQPSREVAGSYCEACQQRAGFWDQRRAYRCISIN